jgi:methyl-accepting chemotaxis protein
VVASEVRVLAQRSAEAAKDIKALIGQSSDRVEAGVQRAGEAGDAMTVIVGRVRHVGQLIAGIADASAQQAGGITEVGAAMAQLDQVTQQNAALVEETSAAADSLSSHAARLADTVGRFRLAGVADDR